MRIDLSEKRDNNPRRNDIDSTSNRRRNSKMSLIAQLHVGVLLEGGVMWCGWLILVLAKKTGGRLAG